MVCKVSIDLIPKPKSVLPMVAIGKARQEMEWLANIPDAWIWHGVNPEDTARIVQNLNVLGDGTTWKPFGYANFVELTENPNESAKLYNNIYLRGGAKGLIDFWSDQKQKGLSHISINFKPSHRPAKELLQEFSEDIIPKI